MTESSAKNEILSAIRSNLAASAAHDAVHAEHRSHLSHVVPKSTAVVHSPGKPIIETFRENLESVGGRCLIVRNIPEAANDLQTIIENLSPQTIAISDSSIVREVFDQIKIEENVLKNAAAGSLFNCDIGITGAQWAIAETGTLVLESEKEFHRLTSLIPNVHICILESRVIRHTMAEVLKTIGTELKPMVTFITGPSRTSDIELTLAIGVHGPREVYVIVVDPQAT